jgi:hypothetical protein
MHINFGPLSFSWLQQKTRGKTAYQSWRIARGGEIAGHPWPEIKSMTGIFLSL